MTFRIAIDENGNNVDARYADRGGRYFCPGKDCNEPVIVAKGSMRAHHFKHRKGFAGSCESEPHRVAKNIVSERKLIRDVFNWRAQNGLVDIEDPRAEEKVGDFYIDLAATVPIEKHEGLKDERIWIEFVYSCPVSREKLKYAEDRGIKVIQVDIKGLSEEQGVMAKALYERSRWKVISASDCPEQGSLALHGGRNPPPGSAGPDDTVPIGSECVNGMPPASLAEQPSLGVSAERPGWFHWARAWQWLSCVAALLVKGHFRG